MATRENHVGKPHVLHQLLEPRVFIEMAALPWALPLLGFAPQVSAAILSAWVVASIASGAWPAALAVLAMAVLVVLLWLPLQLAPSQRV